LDFGLEFIDSWEVEMRREPEIRVIAVRQLVMFRGRFPNLNTGDLKSWAECRSDCAAVVERSNFVLPGSNAETTLDAE
jgi:hypothetical protein